MWGLPVKIKTRLARIDRERSRHPSTLGGAELATARDHLEPKSPQSGSVGLGSGSGSVGCRSALGGEFDGGIGRALCEHEPGIVGNWMCKIHSSSVKS